MRIYIPQFLANLIVKQAQKTPYTHLKGYMKRWWLFRWGGENGRGESGSYTKYAARVHHILRSDEGRDFHNHPWPFVTIILKGGYWELRPVFDEDGFIVGETKKWHGPGSIIFRRANDFHMVELPEGQTSWSLFIMGPYEQEWGFLVPDRAHVFSESGVEQPPKFVPWRTYNELYATTDEASMS